jgi:predicted GNAT family acetyltransferase
MTEAIDIKNNEKDLRFETPIGEEFAYIDYRWYKGTLALMHTFVPEAARGKGISFALAKFALEYARENSLKIMVYCRSVARYIKEHPEYEFLKDKKYYR